MVIPAVAREVTSVRHWLSSLSEECGTCRVNDALTVVAGTGVFANAAGSLHNHGIINLTTM